MSVPLALAQSQHLITLDYNVKSMCFVLNIPNLLWNLQKMTCIYTMSFKSLQNEEKSIEVFLNCGKQPPNRAYRFNTGHHDKDVHNTSSLV